MCPWGCRRAGPPSNHAAIISAANDDIQAAAMQFCGDEQRELSRAALASSGNTPDGHHVIASTGFAVPADFRFTARHCPPLPVSELPMSSLIGPVLHMCGLQLRSRPKRIAHQNCGLNSILCPMHHITEWFRCRSVKFKVTAQNCSDSYSETNMSATSTLSQVL